MIAGSLSPLEISFGWALTVRSGSAPWARLPQNTSSTKTGIEIPLVLSNLTIHQDRLNRELEELAMISDAPPPAVTRVVFTEADLRGRAFVKGLCQEAG